MSALPAVALAAVALVAAVILSSCHEKEKLSETSNADHDATPTMMTTDVSTLISDSGYTRYHITSPLWLMYENLQEPYWKFPDGLFLEKYDNDMRTDATIRCDSAIYLSQRRIWQLDGNVRMRNTAGDRFLTQQLFWDQQKHQVYSDSFIHIERSNRIIEGFGFQSNEQMTSYRVNKPSGIFPVPERKDSLRDNGEVNSAVTQTTGRQSAPDKIQTDVTEAVEAVETE